ncbi:MAG TPA: HD-GYP domain-containing protein [Actinomycetota bacterium]|nr:HD-GYP domain-containing protein [Actinomycetota bacterium]
MERRTERYPSVRPYLAHALVASALVVLLPLAVTMALTALMDPTPPTLVVAAAGVLTALGTIVTGTALWMRRPDSSFIGFSDLMIIRWLQRRHAEKQLAEGTRLLGLDVTGQPVDRALVSAEEQLQVLKDLTDALEAKDPYTHGHSRRVERHSYRTAAAMGLPAADLEDVRKAAALHDVGKIRVSDRILRKDGPLTIEERVMMEEHAVVGAWMVSAVGNADVIAAVRHHHEHWDGSGYPDGLMGSNIPLFARIIAVADAYDALNSTRPYRAGCGRERAVEVLKAESGRQFDPQVVESFLSALPTRLPVAAGLFLVLAGPSRLLRELFAWLRRFGAGSLSPTVGAAGAAVVLGASVFTPNVPPRLPDPAPVERVADVAPAADDAASVPAPVEKEPRKRAKPKPRRDEVVAAAPEAEPDQVLGVTIDRPEPDHEANQARPEPEPQEQPEPEPAPEAESAPEPRGHDGCPPGHAKAKGEGHQKHEDDASC